MEKTIKIDGYDYSQYPTVGDALDAYHDWLVEIGRANEYDQEGKKVSGSCYYSVKVTGLIDSLRVIIYSYFDLQIGGLRHVVVMFTKGLSTLNSEYLSNSNND